MTYKISKEEDQFVVTRKGAIIAWFADRDSAQEYKQAQLRADEQHNVMSAYNDEQESRALLAELKAELADLI